MSESESNQAILDENHLKLLSIGYVVSGAMSGLFAFFGLIYVFAGLMFSSMFAAAAKASPKPQELPPPEMGWIFVFFGAAFFLVLASLAAAKFVAARYIRQRKGRTFCLVVAGISCFGIPYGTLLGVCTFIVLGRPGVKQLYDSSSAG